jgi:hypothetical protein
VRGHQLTRSHQLANPLEARVEAPVEPDLELNSGSADGIQRSVNPCQVQGDGLLTENVFSGYRRFLDHLGMGIGAGADDHRLNLLVFQYRPVVLGDGRDMQVGGQFLGRAHVNVGNGNQAGVWEPVSQIFPMHPADPARADEPHVDFVCHACLLVEWSRL